jgi:hypothetical protein
MHLYPKHLECLPNILDPLRSYLLQQWCELLERIIRRVIYPCPNKYPIIGLHLKVLSHIVNYNCLCHVPSQQTQVLYEELTRGQRVLSIESVVYVSLGV